MAVIVFFSDRYGSLSLVVAGDINCTLNVLRLGCQSLRIKVSTCSEKKKIISATYSLRKKIYIARRLTCNGYLSKKGNAELSPFSFVNANPASQERDETSLEWVELKFIPSIINVLRDRWGFERMKRLCQD